MFVSLFFDVVNNLLSDVKVNVKFCRKTPAWILAQNYGTNTTCYVQCSPFIMLCLGSIGMTHVISKGTILQRSYRKMAI